MPTWGRNVLCRRAEDIDGPLCAALVESREDGFPVLQSPCGAAAALCGRLLIVAVLGIIVDIVVVVIVVAVGAADSVVLIIFLAVNLAGIDQAWHDVVVVVVINVVPEYRVLLLFGWRRVGTEPHGKDSLAELDLSRSDHFPFSRQYPGLVVEYPRCMHL